MCPLSLENEAKRLSIYREESEVKVRVKLDPKCVNQIRKFSIQTVWKMARIQWFWHISSCFVLWWDVFDPDKQTFTCEKWSQVDFGMIPNYRSRFKTKFRSPCSCLGQIKSTHAFSNFLQDKWSFHGVEHNAKRTKSKGCLRWKCNVWEVEVMTWNPRSGNRLNMPWPNFVHTWSVE